MDINYIKQILKLMNDFSIHKVVLKSENYIQIEISKPFDYIDDYFSVYLKDTSLGYIGKEPRVIDWEDFKNLDEFNDSDLYYRVNKYKLENKIIKF